MKILKVSAFGALNEDSYTMFRERLEEAAGNAHIAVELTCAGPYPNAEAVSAPGRPLRGAALKDDAKKAELYAAVAADAKAAGAETAAVRCMPCMSMIAFHKGVEGVLGLPILPLEAALFGHYAAVDKIGVIHMPPAADTVARIFGKSLITPDDAQFASLLAAAEEARIQKSPAPVEAAMKTIAENWRAQGIKHILFARADAPLAEKGPAKIDGVEIESYFGILARTVIDVGLKKAA